MLRPDWASTHHGYYVIDPIEYVDPLPPLDSSLFDDPERTRRVFTDAIESLGSTAESIRALTEEDDKRIIAKLSDYLEDRGNGARREQGHPQ